MTKSFDWYIQNALNKLKHSNFITLIDLNYDAKLGLYFIMKIYNLGFTQCVRGSWEFVMLVNSTDTEKKGLNAEEILKLPMNKEEYDKVKAEYESDSLPQSEKNNRPKKASQPFGWLSPTGDFFESDFGTHCISAENIIKNKNMESEYKLWEKADEKNIIPNDFLCSVKGYVLIHNPSNDGGYVVTNIKPLTKKQREFLYNYFKDIGNEGRASIYISDE